MRWLTYRHDGAERAGILDAGNNVRGFPAGFTMLASETRDRREALGRIRHCTRIRGSRDGPGS